MSSNVRDTARKIRQSLQGKYPAGEADAMTAIIFEKVMNYSRVDMIMREDSEVPEFASARIDDAVARLLRNEPIQHIFGEARFAGHTFKVTPDTLIPRPETEQLVDMIAGENTAPDLRVLDIGTGSGCIAIALKNLFKNWLVSASDISEDALAVAKKNVDAFAPSIHLYQGNSLEPYIKENMAIDILVSNPPYIRNREDVQQSVRDYEPASALYLDDDGSVYESIFRDYKKVKKGSMLMCFEIGYDLKDYLTALMERYLEDYEYEFLEDLNGLTRFLFVFCK